MKKNEFIKIFTALTAVFILIFTLSCSDDDDKVGNGGGGGNDEVCQCAIDKNATVLRVGADKEYKTVKAAADAAGDNTIVEIDAGTYIGDAAIAYWTQNNLVIRAVGGEVILDAGGKHIDNMGIWKIEAGTVCVEGITFQNAKVSDKNGAGIRLVDGNLTVINSHFLHNENGILTGNLAGSSLVIRNSEFGYNGYGDGYSHNLYVGRIASLDVSGSYFHHCSIGHLLKSRAAINKIYYNKLADGDEAESKASYEIDIPSGGQAIIVGNIIQKSNTPDNNNVISFAREENNFYPDNRIYIAYNTIITSPNRTNDKILAAHASTEKYVFNNAIYEKAQFDGSVELTANKGNVSYKTGDLTANYYPISTVLESWKNELEEDIDSYLSQGLKAQSISLIPQYQYSQLNIIPINGKPVIPGAVQRP
ncbi:MAG: hypothetical protein LBQ84_02615 [Flavobacteriaceae bacterium]|jgi:hypothetical protein|nr:hypothetical protein [Flavobacteriaceae bacterium]